MERFFPDAAADPRALANWRKVKTVLEQSGLAPTWSKTWRPDLRPSSYRRTAATSSANGTSSLPTTSTGKGICRGSLPYHQDGRYYLFYAGNDFTSPSNGIGYAVADASPTWRKAEQPCCARHPDWSAPGHASVSVGLDGEPRLGFFHAFHPGTGGYNVFRALMTVGLSFSETRYASFPDHQAREEETSVRHSALLR
jgi:hypothetical protein